MITPGRIAVLVHENESRDRMPPYIMSTVISTWRSAGIRVHVHRGPRGPVDADLLVLHVDLTFVPQAYVDYASRFPRVANAGVLDISKRTVSRNLLGPGDHYDGPVIVKTNLNCGGKPEWCRGEHGHLRQPGTAESAFMHPADYPVYRNVSELPRGTFDDPALVVEKFLPERDGELYCIRSYTFGGDRGWCTLRKSPSPVVKRGTVVSTTVVDVHPSITRSQKELGFDFGKFDFVVHDGRAELLDTNRCPTYPSPGTNETRTLRARSYALGLLETFFPGERFDIDDPRHLHRELT